MRISDWSSDVCSSDLTGRTARRRRAAPAWRVRVAGSWIGHRNPWRGGLLARKHAFGTEVAAEGAALADLALDLQPRLVQLQDVLDDRQAQAGAAGLARDDRKSVASGKRVAVRVDLGGRSIFKKKSS